MIRIGSRPSKLAIAQTQLFVSELKARFPEKEFEIVQITTSGDNKQKLEKVQRDKKDWIVELEESVLSGAIDLALHSAKDVPVTVAEGTSLIPVLNRATPNDVFIGRLSNEKRLRLSELSANAVIGTASFRRRAQILIERPELQIQEFRGNVTSRINKLDESVNLAGIILAAAGLERLGMNLEQFEILPADQILPACCQGILTVQIDSSRQDLATMLGTLSPLETQASFLAERECIRVLEADCHSAVACFSKVSASELEITAKVFGHISLKKIEAKLSGHISEAESLGHKLALLLLENGAQSLLRES
jgi:hydroxymethylbilane synthase